MASQALPDVSEARLLSPTGCEAARWQLDVPRAWDLAHALQVEAHKDVPT